MPRLCRHDPAGRRRGFEIDVGGWRLQTTPRADRFFRISRHYRDDAAVPVLVTRTLVHLGEAKPDEPTPKTELLSRFARLNPGVCGMHGAALAELRQFAERCLEDVGLPPGDLAALDEFLREQTPLEPFGQSEAYLR
jgi:hypothetical protein